MGVYSSDSIKKIYKFLRYNKRKKSKISIYNFQQGQRK